jgi:hypothetical protein
MERPCEEWTRAHLAQMALWKTFGMKAVLVPALIVGDHDCSGMVSGLVLRNDRTPLAAPGPSAPPSAPRRGRSMVRTVVLQPGISRAYQNSGASPPAKEWPDLGPGRAITTQV